MYRYIFVIKIPLINKITLPYLTKEVMLMKESRAIFSAFGFSIIIGLSFMFVKISINYENELLVLAQRFTFAFIAVLIFIIIKPVNLKLNYKEFLIVFIISIFYPIIFFSSQIIGLSQTTVTEAGIIQAIAPAITVLFGIIFLKENVKKAQIFGILLSIMGVIFLQLMNVQGVGELHFIGNMLIVASIFATAIWQVLSRSVTQKIAPIKVTIYIMLIGFIFFNSAYFLKGGSFYGYAQSIPQIQYLVAIIFLGVLSTFGTSLLSIYAVSKLPVIQVTVFNNVATLITILSGILILKEKFYYYHIIGALIIILGVILVNKKSTKSN